MIFTQSKELSISNGTYVKLKDPSPRREREKFQCIYLAYLICNRYVCSSESHKTVEVAHKSWRFMISWVPTSDQKADRSFTTKGEQVYKIGVTLHHSRTRRRGINIWENERERESINDTNCFKISQYLKKHCSSGMNPRAKSDHI